ncbi:hypothetical protein [Calorimonas adulescens]|jgi:DRTGG domain.|uniref:DRTGG domain-containing protein n=1 Tax=Calorimonas adulescens TaxID=2606906 RepID=A0A5D8Q8W4_9THEO|nr:hypothetical protein [Calorimonas adulescens]TZE81215.1 hypothetical protein FWJ32_10090 [Calorimonas adulescens]
MKLSQIITLLDAKPLNEFDPDIEIMTACGADLLSDVLAAKYDKALLLTGLTNIQVIRTAEISDIKAVVFVRGKKPGNDIISLASQLSIPVMTTSYSMFASCGILYKNGLNPGDSL